MVALGRQSKWQRALECLDHSRFLPDVKLYTALCEALERASQWQQAMELLPHGAEDERFLGLAVSACSKGRAWQAALALGGTDFERESTPQFSVEQQENE